MLYLGNAFSLNMIMDDLPRQLTFVEVNHEAARSMVRRAKEADKFVSAIGHEDLASVVSSDIGQEIAVNRISVSLTKRDALLVAQYSGPRLPEGTTELPDDVEIRYVYVRGTQDIEVITG